MGGGPAPDVIEDGALEGLPGAQEDQTGAGSRARVGRGVQDGQRGGHGGPGPARQVLPRLRGSCSSSRHGVPPRPLPLPPVRTLAAPSFSSPFRQN